MVPVRGDPRRRRQRLTTDGRQRAGGSLRSDGTPAGSGWPRRPAAITSSRQRRHLGATGHVFVDRRDRHQGGQAARHCCRTRTRAVPRAVRRRTTQPFARYSLFAQKDDQGDAHRAAISMRSCACLDHVYPRQAAWPAKSVVLFGSRGQVGEPLPSISLLLNVPRATIWMVCHNNDIAVKISLWPVVTVALFFETSA